MAKKQKADGSEAEAVEVRALITDETFGLVAGAVATVAADDLAALKASGMVDDHPDAVAYARGA